MDQEISKGTWIGAGILAIVAILGLAFAVYGIARNLVNNSSADFVKTVDSVGNSSFNDYDGTTVSGLQVRAAIDNYEGKKVAIFINTSAIQLAVNGSTDSDATASDMTGYVAKLVRQEPLDESYNNAFVFGGKVYVNYNGLLDFDAGATLKDSNEGYLTWTGPFKLKKLADGTVTSDLMYNTVKTNLKTTGCTEFVILTPSLLKMLQA